MKKLEKIDFEFLLLGKTKKSFNEIDIQDSDLNKLGIGQIFDKLGEFLSEGFLLQDSKGSFELTKTGHLLLWDKNDSLEKKILKILKIKPLEIEKLEKYLDESLDQIEKEIQHLRSINFILMAPFRKEKRLVKMYEILPEGLEKLQEIENKKEDTTKYSKNEIEKIKLIIEEILQIVNMEKGLEKENKETLIRLIQKLKKEF